MVIGKRRGKLKQHFGVSMQPLVPGDEEFGCMLDAAPSRRQGNRRAPADDKHDAVGTSLHRRPHFLFPPRRMPLPITRHNAADRFNRVDDFRQAELGDLGPHRRRVLVSARQL